MSRPAGGSDPRPQRAHDHGDAHRHAHADTENGCDGHGDEDRHPHADAPRAHDHGDAHRHAHADTENGCDGHEDEDRHPHADAARVHDHGDADRHAVTHVDAEDGSDRTRRRTPVGARFDLPRSGLEGAAVDQIFVGAGFPASASSTSYLGELRFDSGLTWPSRARP
jgi:hypothetical protein